MLDFLPYVGSDIHAILAHFPIALLTLSFALSVLGARWRALDPYAWAALVVGAVAAVAATVTGLAVHEPYEGTSAIGAIETHLQLGLFGTVLTLALTLWRWHTRRRGNDAGVRLWYRAVALVGLAWVTLLGGTGGNLVYGRGVNVRAVNPLHTAPAGPTN
jgi:uncharacterized membrane protein